MTDYFNEDPEETMFMSPPKCETDVYFRKNVKKTTDDKENALCTVEEVYFRTLGSEIYIT